MAEWNLTANTNPWFTYHSGNTFVDGMWTAFNMQFDGALQANAVTQTEFTNLILEENHSNYILFDILGMFPNLSWVMADGYFVHGEYELNWETKDWTRPIIDMSGVYSEQETPPDPSTWKWDGLPLSLAVVEVKPSGNSTPSGLSRWEKTEISSKIAKYFMPLSGVTANTVYSLPDQEYTLTRGKWYEDDLTDGGVPFHKGNPGEESFFYLQLDTLKNSLPAANNTGAAIYANNEVILNYYNTYTDRLVIARDDFIKYRDTLLPIVNISNTGTQIIDDVNMLQAIPKLRNDDYTAVRIGKNYDNDN